MKYTNWLDYYLPLMGNPELEKRFQDKYAPMFMLIQQILLKSNGKIDCIIEHGCGTALVSKLLIKEYHKNHFGQNFNYVLTDLDDDMLELARINLINVDRRKQFIQHDMLKNGADVNYAYTKSPRFISDMVITHGVLEHFNEEQIVKYLTELNDSEKVHSHIHYVPTDGYIEKSFGDENLWSVEKWITMTKPDIALKNGPDLYLAFTTPIP